MSPSNSDSGLDSGSDSDKSSLGLISGIFPVISDLLTRSLKLLIASPILLISISFVLSKSKSI